jgi:fructose-1-phosphate kinase PfkB-like protein
MAGSNISFHLPNPNVSKKPCYFATDTKVWAPDHSTSYFYVSVTANAGDSTVTTFVHTLEQALTLRDAYRKAVDAFLAQNATVSV